GFHLKGFSLAVRLLVRRRVSSGGARPELLVDNWFDRWRSRSKIDMHTYVSQLKDTELETLIATYDIPLDLRPRLPDPNFRMINLPAADTTIGTLWVFGFPFPPSS
ncbi:hypothetical protein Tco_0124434, partial [Tanacetum coccineum]